MKLFLVHCGFYNETWGSNIFENHTNFFVVAESAAAAKKQVKEKPECQNLRMHIDGIIEIQQVDGYQIELKPTANTQSQFELHTHRELAAKSTPVT